MALNSFDKERVVDLFGKILPPTEAGLLSGVILGDKSGMDKMFYRSLVNSGVLHLVVVSGSNVMLVVRLVVDGLSGLLGRKKAIGAGLVLAWGYVNMVGWQIPIIRAIMLTSIYYWSQLLGRKFDVWRAFGVTIGLMLIIDWKMITELSFWLTFLAFGGLITRKGEGGRWRNFKTSFWISLWVSPLLLYTIGSVSLLAPVTTYLLVSVAEWSTLFGLMGVVISRYLMGLGKVIIWLVMPLLSYGVKVVDILGRNEWSVVNFKVSWVTMAGAYLVLGGYLFRRKHWRNEEKTV